MRCGISEHGSEDREDVDEDAERFIGQLTTLIACLRDQPSPATEQAANVRLDHV